MTTRTRTSQDVTISPRLITALDRTWAAIQRRHPDVPDVVITLGAGSGSTRGLKYGHFADQRWQRADAKLPELFIGGEGLQRGARGVLGTLLHEAAHGVASVRGIQDTSRQGRWHNKRFATLARELGIDVAQAPSIGWSETSVPDATAKVYRAELRRLESALVAYRHAEGNGRGRGGRTSNNNGVSAHCGCGRKIRVAESILAAGPITCGVCGEDFEA